MRRARIAALAAAFAALLALPARGADLYGKPLRGLTAVRVAAVVADPARYATKPVRVEGANAGSAGKPALKDGDAVLPVVPDGSWTLPADLAGGTLAAEGRARAEKDGVVFVATGLEVKR